VQFSQRGSQEKQSGGDPWDYDIIAGFGLGTG